MQRNVTAWRDVEMRASSLSKTWAEDDLGEMGLDLGPRDQRQDMFRQVYNEKLTDDAILKIEPSETGDVGVVDLSGPHVTDRGFSHLAGNPRVSIVICRRSMVTDAGLASLAGKSNLTHLFVSGNNITDLGVSSISQLKSLRFISFQGTLIANRALKGLASCHSLLRSPFILRPEGDSVLSVSESGGRVEED